MFGGKRKEKGKGGKSCYDDTILLDGLVEKVSINTYTMMSVSWKTIQRGEDFPVKRENFADSLQYVYIW